MPPKVKYTREEMLDAALALTRERGISAVTARELGARLGVSARPVFTAFQNMEDVNRAIRERAYEIFYGYLADYRDYHPAFKRYGTQLVAFAQQEPKLFQLLFMSPEENPRNFLEALVGVMGDLEEILSMVEETYHLTRPQAQSLFDQLWVHAYGICVLCAMQVCTFSQEQVGQMLSEVFVGLIGAYHSPQFLSNLRDGALKQTSGGEEHGTEAAKK